ncbi:glyoxalase superfamily protein [Serratia sp. Se-RSBMAAmG]|uniref:glyoxalase superfamily protein n=1 Tax=Serratia sp. Se-RSBMAAmG TaxID=3043305 RepID=UPI0024AF8922|nr:glyoxalase superfamily protein [Serratia sp. Se-RSBMAAmG]MDI6976206.1 glyoxalase superfamily protein [Serratia sp. Se-RSBMAAmG]
MKHYSFNNENDIKDLAYNLKKHLTEIGHNVKHMDILNSIAQSVGFKNWNIYSAELKEKNKPYVYKNPFVSIKELFNQGSAAQITEFLVFNAFREENSNHTDNGMWKGRAISLASGIMRSLVWLRENECFSLTGQSIYKSMDLSNMISLSKKEILPSHVSEPLKAYLVSLPGYKNEASAEEEQSETAYEQHGYLQNQFKSIIDMK